MDMTVTERMQAMGFTKWILTWEADSPDAESEHCEATFWLPEGEDPKDHVADILNLVELSASEHGYKYDLHEDETDGQD